MSTIGGDGLHFTDMFCVVILYAASCLASAMLGAWTRDRERASPVSSLSLAVGLDVTPW